MTTSGGLNDFLAREIRAAMARRRMTGRQLARALGESHTWVSRRLTSMQVGLGAYDVERICAVLDLSVGSLLGLPDGSSLAPELTTVPIMDTRDTGPITSRYPWALPERVTPIALVGDSPPRYWRVVSGNGSSRLAAVRDDRHVDRMAAAPRGNCANAA